MGRESGNGTPRIGAALDLDGVLIDGMPYHFVAFDAALRTFGVAATRRDVALLEGMRTREVIRLVANAYGEFPSDEALDEAELLKRRTYSEIFEPTPLDGARRLLDVLIGYGCHLAIVTGTADASARAAVKALDMDGCIEVIVSHDSNIPLKPHPAPFATAVKQLGVEPARCLAVENAPAGVRSARAAELPCVAAATYVEPSDLEMATRVFGSIAELAEWLAAADRLDPDGRWVI